MMPHRRSLAICDTSAAARPMVGPRPPAHQPATPALRPEPDMMFQPAGGPAASLRTVSSTCTTRCSTWSCRLSSAVIPSSTILV